MIVGFQILPYNYYLEGMSKILIPEIYDDKLSVIIKPVSLKGGLYLGNQQGARDIEMLKKTKVTAVLTISKQIQILFKDMAHYHIKIADSPFENIKEYFSKTYQFIDKHRQNGNVFVHCQAGISRSASIVIAYLMRKSEYSLKKAYEKVKLKRAIVKPNQGFLMQLQGLQGELNMHEQKKQKVQKKQIKPQKKQVKYR